MQMNVQHKDTKMGIKIIIYRTTKNKIFQPSTGTHQERNELARDQKEKIVWRRKYSSSNAKIISWKYNIIKWSELNQGKVHWQEFINSSLSLWVITQWKDYIS
jgi:hypothetical protein